MLKLAFRNIFRNYLRTALTLAAIVTGVVSLILSGGFVEDSFVELREATIHSRIGHLQIFKNGYLEYGQRDVAQYSIDQPKIVVTAIKNIPHVQSVMTRISFSGLANNGRADMPVIGEGIEPDKEALLGTATTVIAGRALKNSDTFGIFIGEGVASSLRLKPGSFISLMVNTQEGALNTMEYEVIGVFRSISKDYDDRAVRIPFAAAQELLYTQSVQSVVVLLDNTSATEAALSLIKDKLKPLGYEVKSWYELADFYKKTEALYRRQFGALQCIILVMLVLSVASTINMVVYERTGEFGTLLAVGLRRRQILNLILTENLLLGLLGGLLGIVFGVALASLISNVGIAMPPPPGSNRAYTATIRIVPWILLAAALMGAFAALVAAILPARRASKLTVVDALRQNI